MCGCVVGLVGGCLGPPASSLPLKRLEKVQFVFWCSPSHLLHWSFHEYSWTFQRSSRSPALPPSHVMRRTKTHSHIFKHLTEEISSLLGCIFFSLFRFASLHQRPQSLPLLPGWEGTFFQRDDFSRLRRPWHCARLPPHWPQCQAGVALKLTDAYEHCKATGRAHGSWVWLNCFLFVLFLNYRDRNRNIAIIRNNFNFYSLLLSQCFILAWTAEDFRQG